VSSTIARRRQASGVESPGIRSVLCIKPRAPMPRE
jgi:hypothetical protein